MFGMNSRKKRMIGYITMTGDTPHQGHFDLLRACRGRCDRLIVGITDDDVAKRQKRVPIMPWIARRACFADCKYVDDVTVHKGEPKSVACKRLQVDICFTTDEYVSSPEFDELRENAPHVKIVSFARMPEPLCSTDIWRATRDRVLSGLTIFRRGVSGPLLRYDNTIIKLVVCAQPDMEVGLGCRDGFGFFNFKDMPRNHTYIGEEEQFPCISGINPNREVILHRHLADKKWSLAQAPFTSAPFVHALLPTLDLRPILTDVYEFANYVKLTRDRSVQTIELFSKYGGQTLEEFLLASYEQRDLWTSEFDYLVGIFRQVYDFTCEIRTLGILHNDLHLRNITVQDGRIGIIDWGWASAHLFDLDKKEREWLVDELEQNRDWQTFHAALTFHLETHLNEERRERYLEAIAMAMGEEKKAPRLP